MPSDQTEQSSNGVEHWVCPDCEGEWRGDRPPQTCPVDATPRSEFVPADEWDKRRPWDVEEAEEQSTVSASDVFGGENDAE